MKQTFKVVREPVTNAFPKENFTLGKLYLDNVLFSQCCEDEDRFLELGKNKKVYGKTAIPRGKYKLVTSFSNRFQKVLPAVLNVPGFEGIRIHGGNTAEDSHGCILVGQVRTRGERGIAQCAATVQRIIDQIDDAADLGIESWLVVE